MQRLLVLVEAGIGLIVRYEVEVADPVPIQREIPDRECHNLDQLHHDEKRKPEAFHAESLRLVDAVLRR